MAGDLTPGTPANTENHQQVADGGHVGIAAPTYADLALRLLDAGYEPVPVKPQSKAVAPQGWTTGVVDAERVDGWSCSFGHCGIGLRTGRAVAIDIDLHDPDAAHAVAARATELFGDTLVRVGRWPKRLLIYRTLIPIRKLSVPGVEILGLGQQFVAFGIHPDTRQPYEWVTGESPCEVPLDALPVVDEAGLQLFLTEAASLTGHLAAQRRDRSGGLAAGGQGDAPTRNAEGLVIDGRDGWLSRIAFHTVQDAVEAGKTLDPLALADRAWIRFAATTELARARQDGRRRWSFGDAQRKVADKLALLAAGRLPVRDLGAPVPEPLGALLASDEARTRLGEAIDTALAAVTDWWSGDRSGERPAFGLRATVGLGKSAVSRGKIAAWQRDMGTAGLPHRVLVVTPSHALAEEAAMGWRAVTDAPVAVLRGYEGKDAATGAPMCRDVEMVKLALHEKLGIGRSVCRSSATWCCPHYDGCLKQRNRREVAAADIVLAPYDVLFTGPAAGTDPFGLIVIDEGCWQRATDDVVAPPLGRMAAAGLSGLADPSDPHCTARLADLMALRQQVAAALALAETGAVQAADLIAAGLTRSHCETAAGLENGFIAEVALYPGMKPRARRAAVTLVKRNTILRRMVAVWQALAAILTEESPPVLRLGAPDADTGERSVTLHGRKHLMGALAGTPVLHLDATLRPELAGCILPGLEMIRIEAEQPHQHVTLIAGSFGKTSLCPSDSLPQAEQQRRLNRLRDVVDHVRWQARCVAPGKVLVITYMAIEDAFQSIPGVETAHFNAIAGLDQYRDVDMLIVVGRPLPSTDDLGPLCASLFGHLPDGRYHRDIRAVHLRGGGQAVVRTLAHPDPQAELLRAAVCDDELIQAIGRGRGVNRTAANPLEVQALADVALPLIHDRVVAWDAVVPDVVQRMLLAGVAVDSPADAAALHPGLLGSADAVESAFRRAAFNRQTPIGTLYREMTVKSAGYRRDGRGRSWQRAWWIDGEPDEMRRRLEAVLGVLAGWEEG